MAASNNSGIGELYNFALERCSFLMENDTYGKIIVADDEREITLAKGYFLGFYEAMQMIGDQMKNSNQ